MKLEKLIFLAFILMFELLLPKGAFSLKINKIKIEGNSHTKEEIILAIASEFLSDKEFSEEELNGIARRVEERLKNTTWFYSSRVYIVPSARGEEYRNVVIEVNEGFLLRFSGGYAYGMAGMDNIWGNGEKIFLYLGYNRQGIDFELDNLWRNFFAICRVGNFNEFYHSSYTNKVDLQKVGGKLEVGYRFNWDTRIGALVSYSWVANERYEFMFNDYYTGIKLEFDNRSDLFSATSGCYFLVGLKWLGLERIVSGLDLRSFIPLAEGVRIAIRGVLELGDNLPTEYKLSTIGIDGIRGTAREDMLGNVKVQGNIELRGDVFDTTVLGFLNIRLEGVLFLDIGKCYESLEKLVDFENIDYPTALGGGIRLYFMEPVFLPLRLEVGLDKNLSWNILFSISEPF